MLLQWGIHCEGQIAISPATTSCACDGSFTYAGPLNGPLQVALTDAGGSIAFASNIAGGPVSVNALCPQVYILTVTSPGGTVQEILNIPGGGVSPGTASEQVICSTSGPTPLSDFLPGYTPGGIWTNPQGGPDNGVYNATSEGPGLYVYSLNSGGCPVTTGVLVDEIINSNAGLSTTYLICENYAPFYMTDVLAGQPDPTGTWYYTGGSAMDGWYDPSIMNTTLFSYEVPGVPGCDPVVSTLFVLENQYPDPGENTSILVCENGTSFSMYEQLLGTPVAGGTWFNASNTPVPDLFDPVIHPSGVYRYHVDGQTPCSDEDSFLTITFTSTNPSGEDASFIICESAGPVQMINELSGSPIPGGTWTNSAHLATDGVFDPATEIPGDFYYYIPNVGCTPAFATLSVTVETQPEAGTDQVLSVCAQSGVINLTNQLSAAADPGGQWTLNGQSVSQSFNPLNPGTYSFQYQVTGQDCPSDASSLQVHVDTPPDQPIDISDVLCQTDDPVVLADYYPAFINLQFTDASGTSASQFIPASPPPQPFTVIQLSGNSCPNSAATLSFDVELPAFTSDAVYYPVCQSQQVADLNGNGFNTDYSSGNWTYLGNPAAQFVPLNFTGVRSYQFISAQVNSCPVSVLDLTLESFPEADAGPDGSVILCHDAAPFQLPEFLPLAPPSGMWLLNDQPVNDLLFDPATSLPGIYKYSLTGNLACPGDTADLQISIDQGILLDAGTDLSGCAGMPDLLIGPAAVPGYQYSWNASPLITQTGTSITTFQFIGNAESILQEELILTADNGTCAMRDTLLATVFPLPILQITGESEVCEDEQIILIASGAQNYVWQPAVYFETPTGPIQSFTPSGSFTTDITGTNEYGCEASVEKVVTVHPNPQLIVFPEPTSGCPPLNYTIELDNQSTDIDQIIWTLNGVSAGTGDSFQVTLEDPGWYDLGAVATSIHGCTSSADWPDIAEVLSNPVADFTYEPLAPSILDPTVQFHDLSQNAVTYHWEFDSTGEVSEPSPAWAFSNDEPGFYRVCLRVESEEGCPDSICRIIPVINATLFYAPNAFTPDEDGVNDVFFPVYMGYSDEYYSLQVHDRWGVLIFDTHRPEEVWTGNILGGNYYAQPDVYLWRVELKTRNLAEYVTFKGHVALIR